LNLVEKLRLENTNPGTLVEIVIPNALAEIGDGTTSVISA
jgi:hypothetical protein